MEGTYFLCIRWLGILVLNFKGSQCECFDKEVLINDVAPQVQIGLLIAALFVPLLLFGAVSCDVDLIHVGCLKEATKSFEKTHYFWLAEDIREYFEISAEP